MRERRRFQFLFSGIFDLVVAWFPVRFSFGSDANSSFLGVRMSHRLPPSLSLFTVYATVSVPNF